MSYLLHDLLAESARRYPQRPAVCFNDQELTYAGLHAESDRLALALSSRGVVRGDRIGIYLNRGIASIVAVFGVLKAGAAYVPLDPASPPSRIAYIAETCGPKVLLTSRDKLGALRVAFPEHAPFDAIFVLDDGALPAEPVGTVKVVDWQHENAALDGSAPVSNVVDRDLAYVLFTSGSTGRPKGVMLSHLNALTFVRSAHEFFQVSSEDRLSNVCPLHFDMSVFDVFVAMSAGAAIVIVPETVTMFPVRLAQTIARSRLTIWNSVPSALSLLATYADLPRHDLSALRLILFAGEPFPSKYLRRLQQALPAARFCNMYGQTEANSSTYYWVASGDTDGARTLPIGRPLPNFDVFALAEDGSPLTADGQEGELYVRASTVALGYWGEPEKTARAFVRHPLRPELTDSVYKTGDLVRLDGAGNFVFVGRRDHMIKSRGYRIELGEIEALLESHPAVSRAAVIPVPDELVGNRISAFVVPAGAGELSKEQIVQYCLAHLPKYMVPEIVEFRTSLPTTSSGKIDRQQLRCTQPTAI